MRVSFCILVLTVVVIQGAAAQDSEPTSTMLLTDSEGDVQYLVAEEQGIPAVDDHGPADLLSLSLTETDDVLSFTVSVANLEETLAGTTWDAASLDIEFKHGDIFYTVRTGIYQQGDAFGEVRRQEGFSVSAQEAGFEMDGQGSFTVHVPRDALRNQDGAPPSPGSLFTDFYVDSHVHATGVFLVGLDDGRPIQPVGIRDRMPDAQAITYEVLLGGPAASGPIRLDVPSTHRASNGGATTLAYPFSLTNAGESPTTYRFSTQGAPAPWTLTHPDAVMLAGGETYHGFVVVDTPSGHEHGGIEEFVLRSEAEDTADQWAEATLGIYYLDVPQPAGHHRNVYIHTASTGFGAAGPLFQAFGSQVGGLWMNTLDSEETADGAPVQGGRSQTSMEEYRWYVCLSPVLQLGLDFDVTEVGTATIPLMSDVPTTGTLSGELIHVGTGDEGQCWPTTWEGRTMTTLANLAPTSGDLQGGHIFQGNIVPTAASDYVPFQARSDLVLILRYVPDTPVPIGPALQAGGRLSLPLLEYYDERPAGSVGAPAAVDSVPADTAVDETPGESEAAPVAGWLPLLALTAALWTARRR